MSENQQIARTMAKLRDPERADARIGLGMLYAGMALVSLVMLRAGPDGFAVIAFIFIVAWVTDIASFFVGRRLRGPRLWPAISPGKTWSGAIGGTISAVVAGMAVYLVYFPMKTLWVPAIALVLSSGCGFTALLRVNKQGNPVCAGEFVRVGLTLNHGFNQSKYYKKVN